LISFAAHSIVVSQNGKRAADALHRGVPFCICHLPGSSDTRFYSLSGNPDLGAFVIHPWNYSKSQRKEVWMYRAEDPHYPAVPLAAPPVPVQYGELPVETTFASYQLQFEAYQKAFAESSVQKAILSRVKVVHKSPFFEPLSFFAQITTEYPDTMTYLLYHPEFGMWAAATPEVLLTKNGNTYRTVSLAGTMRVNPWGTYRWGAKELEEQEFVSEHIRRALGEAAIATWTEKGPYNRHAGKVVHLESSFEWEIDSGIDFIKYLLSDLHPTPAVAGLPANEAATLISRTEKHDRSLYTGYIGTLDLPYSANLYVNLRCMQIGEKEIALYSGGGLTAHSKLEAEWEEADLKTLTLLKHIHA
jgi:isochorismate synthase